MIETPQDGPEFRSSYQAAGKLEVLWGSFTKHGLDKEESLVEMTENVFFVTKVLQNAKYPNGGSSRCHNIWATYAWQRVWGNSPQTIKMAILDAAMKIATSKK